jgi:hypothetical protein
VGIQRHRHLGTRSTNTWASERISCYCPPCYVKPHRAFLAYFNFGACYLRPIAVRWCSVGYTSMNMYAQPKCSTFDAPSLDPSTCVGCLREYLVGTMKEPKHVQRRGGGGKTESQHASETTRPPGQGFRALRSFRRSSVPSSASIVPGVEDGTHKTRPSTWPSVSAALRIHADCAAQ